MTNRPLTCIKQAPLAGFDIDKFVGEAEVTSFGKQTSLAAAAAFCLIFFWQSWALACGTIRMWTSAYERGARHKALFHMMDCADSYKAPVDDFSLLPIITDALGRGGEVAEMAKKVFKKFNHLWGARQEPGYAKALKAVTGISDYRKLRLYDSWYYVTARSGANMRNRPSLDGDIVTVVKFGMQVVAGKRVGQWLHAMPVGPGAIDHRFQHKEDYIHQSLLHPY
jgi:hypothetical protein